MLSVVAAVNVNVSPSTSVSFETTSILVIAASSVTVAISAIVTGASFTAVTVMVNVPVISESSPSDTV